MNILIITSEWPSDQHPNHVPFLVEQVQYLRENGIKAEVHKISTKSILSKIISIIELRIKLKKHRYDIIHTHWGYNGLFCLGSNTPHVVTYHGSDLNKPNRFNFRLIILYFISRLSTTFSNYNVFVSKRLAQSSLRANKNRRIIPMGVDLKKFFPMDKSKCRKKLKMPLKKKLILFGGNSTKTVKRISLAENSIDLLGHDYELIKIDYIDHKLVPIYINACDLLLMTSESEGSPMMIKEALACNKPIISTNVGDVAEQINSLDNCFVLNDESPQIFAKKIKECIENNKMPNGRHMIKKKYSLEKSTNCIINIYKSII
ncbi:MAG: hypothetical protein CMP73_05800 [Flavobacteriales bacterium]|nr:hypothetical protein [Flavobacteriales bacterium]